VSPTGRGRRARRTVRTAPRIRLRAQLLGAGAYLLAGVMLAPTLLAPPPDATAGAEEAMIAAAGPLDAPQALSVTDAPEVEARDGYAVRSRAEMLRQRYTLSYSTDWTGAIRWPFPTPVQITSGFGYRKAPCAGCSTDHRALDFAPGGSVPIYAIADGVVVEHEDGNGSWGNYVIVEHRIGGAVVRSSYAHMARGSSPLAPGDRIGVGEFIGMVGRTGQATGVHLHLEIQVDGVKVDPYSWLTASAG